MRNLISFTVTSLAVACLVLLPAGGVGAQQPMSGDDAGAHASAAEVSADRPEASPDRPEVVKPTVQIDTVRCTNCTGKPDSLFTVKFRFGVAVTGFTSEDITLGGAIKLADVEAETGDSIFNLNIRTGENLEGSITVTVRADAAFDAGNDGNSAKTRSFAVDNKSPMLEQATGTAQTIVLRYHERLDNRFQAAETDFLVWIKRRTGSASLAVAASQAAGLRLFDNEVTLTLAATDTIHAGDSVWFTYTQNSNQLRDEKGNYIPTIPATDSVEVTNLRSLSRPGVVRNLTATGTHTDTIKVDWDRPAETGGSQVTGYRVQARKDGEDTYRELRSGSEADTVSAFSHGGLQAGETWHYLVSAMNDAGIGPTKAITGTTKREGRAPGAPTGLRATADGDDAIELRWTAPTDTGTSAISGYKIQYSSDGTTGWTNLEANTNSTSTSYTDSPLQPNTTRHYRLAAINATGPGAYSNVDNATTDPEASDPPDPPRNLTATAASSSQINLSWTEPADDNGSAVTGYRIEVSADAGSSWTDHVVNTGSTATTYPHTGLDPSTTRHYRVSAINSGGTSNPSNVASATTTANLPGRPTGLTATAQGENQINLSWTAPADDGGSVITGYRIEVSLQRTTGWTVRVANTNADDTEWEDTGLDAGSTRYYRVSAINSAGAGRPSNVAFATTDARVPNAPRGLTASAQQTTHTIYLQWTASSDDGGAPITGYEVEVTVDLDSVWTVLDTTATSFPSYEHTNLDPGSTRHYRVSAINSAGKGPASNVATATTDAVRPGAPENLTATAVGPTQIDLTWDAPADDGGADITAYRIWFSVTGGQTWSLLTGSTGSDATTWSDMGLDPATSRHYRVAAINPAGIGPQSDTASAMTDAVPPDPPTELTATKRGTSQIDLEWTAPSYTGGVSLRGYQVEASSDGGSQWEILEANTLSLSTKYSHTGLDPASTRHYRVSAINTADLVGEPSNVDSATTDARAPDPPTNLMAEADGTSQIDLSWTAPAYDGGAAVTGYRIEVSVDRGLVWNDLVENTNNTNTAYSHTGLSPATTRHYRVSAINRVGPGDPSNETEATTDATVPNAPLRLTANAEDHQQIDLDWDIPDFDGGAEITGYRIEVSENAGATWTNLVANTGSATTAYSHTGLDPASTRHYRVSAINEIGIGEPSNVANATTDAVVPDPPTNLVATAKEPTLIELNWSAPAYNGGAPIVSYRIEVSEDGISWTDLQRSTGVSLTTYSHVGLKPGSTRHYRVSAINIAGTGSPSNTASATTDDPVERAGRVNEAILPHFAAAATTSTLSAISARIEAVASRNPLPSQLSAAGLLQRATGMGMRGSGDGLNMARLFDGASFATSLGGDGQAQENGTPLGLTTWGGAEYTSMGQPGGKEVEWEGDMLSIHIGADARVHRDILAGVAGSRSTGNYDFTDVTGEREVEGTYEATMTSLNPYVAWLPGRRGVSIWAAGSFGWGEVTVDDEPGGQRSGDTRSRAGALGGSRIMMTNGASALRVRAEGWMSQVDVDGGEQMDSLTLDMRRLRVALEWTQVQALPGGREVNFLVEGGLRYGDGDGTEGAGMEVGGGVRFVSGTRALTVEGHGRLLATSPTDYEEWGVRGLIQINPQAVTRGLSVKIVPTWGQAASGLQELYERGVSNRPDMSQDLQRGRLNTRVEYGLGEFSGTPYGRFYLADGGARAFGTGMKYEITRILDLRFEGTRTESAGGPARHGLAMRGRWVF